MTVEQQLDDLRGIVFGQILRREPAHGRYERGRIARQIEGEPVGTTPARFEIVPGALRVRVPG